MTSQYHYEITINYRSRNHWDNLAIERVENQIIEYMDSIESGSLPPRARIMAIDYGMGSNLTIGIWTRNLEIAERIRNDLENLIERVEIEPIRELLE